MRDRLASIIEWGVKGYYRVKLNAKLAWALGTKRGLKSRYDFWWTVASGLILLWNIVWPVEGNALLTLELHYLVIVVLSMLFAGYLRRLWLRIKVLRNGVANESWLARYTISGQGWRDLGIYHVAGKVIQYWEENPDSEQLEDYDEIIL